MIELKNISKKYYQDGKTIHALQDVSLCVQKGEIYGVVGESGAGKSTLIRCVNLLERPTAGQVVIAGKNLMHLDNGALLSARHNIGMIFQHFNLLSSRTVEENIALPLELIGRSKSDIHHKINSLLDLTGLTDKAKNYPAQLSGGQKQRVAIARALASDPHVLLSDEATSALDPKTTESILNLLKEINEKLGVTILLITHEMDVVKKICTHVALLEQGRLVENNTVEAFFTAPQSELGQHFVSQIQQFDLPARYANRLKKQGNYPIVKLIFQNDSVNEPVISSLTRRFNVDVNIIQAKVEVIATITAGVLIAELLGDIADISAALRGLNEYPVDVEVLGYVTKNH